MLDEQYLCTIVTDLWFKREMMVINYATSFGSIHGSQMKKTKTENVC